MLNQTLTAEKSETYPVTSVTCSIIPFLCIYSPVRRENSLQQQTKAEVRPDSSSQVRMKCSRVLG